MKRIVILFLLFFYNSAAYAQPMVERPAIDSAVCINNKTIFSFTPIDSNFQRCYKACIPNLIASIKACGYGYQYDAQFSDQAMELVLPASLNTYSLTFGDNDFMISFEDQNKASADCIVLYYHLEKQNNKPKDPARGNSAGKNKLVKHFNSRKGIYNGEISMSENISIGYYTDDPKLEKLLSGCISSCILRD